MDKKSYLRQVPRIDLDETLFPPEKAAPQPEYTRDRGSVSSSVSGAGKDPHIGEILTKQRDIYCAMDVQAPECIASSCVGARM